MQLDPMNLEILELLQEDGRRTYSDIAEEMDRAESTIRDRVQRLEEMGFVQRYTAVLDPRKLGLSGRALVRARVPGDSFQDAVDGLLGIPQVTNIHHTSGERNLGMVVTAGDVVDLESVLRDVAASTDLRRMKTDLVLRTVAQSRPLPLREFLEQVEGEEDQAPGQQKR